MSKLIGIVVSVYNEQEGLELFYDTLKECLDRLVSERSGYDYDICFVNDGSTDGSQSVLDVIKEKDPEHVTVITFSRNFGHEAAMTAGLDYSGGDYLIFMDADLQHPPACIPEIMDCFEAGHSIINMVREKNEGAGAFGNAASALFYKLINRIDHRLRYIRSRQAFVPRNVTAHYCCGYHRDCKGTGVTAACEKL